MKKVHSHTTTLKKLFLYRVETTAFLESLILVAQRGMCTKKLRNPNISGDGRGLKIHYLLPKASKPRKPSHFFRVFSELRQKSK